MNALKGTFLLGLGAQKAGSTWAQDYLAADTRANFGPIKEYHVWDVLNLPYSTQFDHRRQSSLLSCTENIIRKIMSKGPNPSYIRGRLQSSPETYFSFFSTLLSKEGVALTGDITPLYAALPPNILKMIRSGFSDRNINVRAMFLMRDPVSRCISAAQMNRRKGDLNEGVPLKGTLDEAVIEYAKSPQSRLRADYRRTIETLRDSFEEKDIYFGFYETMFTTASAEKLSQFTGVRSRPELCAQRVNSFAKSEKVSIATRAALREILEADYSFCLSEFPELRHHWMK